MLRFEFSADGASSVLLASENWAKEKDLPILAYLAFSEVAAVDFYDKKEGLLMAPAYAVPRMLDRAGLTLLSKACLCTMLALIGPNSVVPF